MSTGPPRQCLACAHWKSPLESADGAGRTCSAFPAGVPDEIWDGRADHRKPYPGDRGIRWQPFGGSTKHPAARIRNAVDPNDIDLSGVQHDFELHLNQILDHWTGITQRQINEIIAQVENAIDKGDIRRLAKLSASTADAEEALRDAMTSMALSAAQRVVDEAAAQGRNIDPVASDTKPFSLIATATAGLLVGALANAAGREALRRWTPGMSASDVGSGVREHLDSLSGSFLKDNLGGALSHAETTGRVNTMLTGPSAAIYASEQLDAATCGPCREINGKWIGNSDDPDIQAKIDAVYPRGYVGCLGGDRCRGQLVSVYRDPGEGFVGATVGGALATAIRLPLNHPGHGDQKSHGRKGGAEQMHDEATIRATYDFDDGPSGLSARVTSIGPLPGHAFAVRGATAVRIEIRDKSGQVVGHADRIIHPASAERVHHANFELDSGVQGQGFGARYAQQVEQSYRENGIRSITLDANKDVGGYAWARAGYEFSNPDDRDAIARTALSGATDWRGNRQVDDSTLAEIERVAGNPNSSPADFAMIGHKPGAEHWYGKDLLLGNAWGGVKSL